MNNKPQARQDGLIVRELEDEILIFDTKRNKAHCFGLMQRRDLRLSPKKELAADKRR